MAVFCVLAMVKFLIRFKIVVVQSVEAFCLVGQSLGRSVGQSLGLINSRNLPVVKSVSKVNANLVDVLALAGLVTDRLMQLNPIRYLLLVVIA